MIHGSFGHNLFFLDCFAYIALYLAIRGSNWQLRIASLKLMAPLFSAFDRDLYQQIIPNHLADIQQYPKEILQCFQAGGFTVSLNGRQWHSVHLTKHTRVCKQRPRTSNYLSYTLLHVPQKNNIIFQPQNICIQTLSETTLP